ncbi:MAG: hypothetical protein MI723_05605, partial [Caulobacterales bacterium]|nr:hypothetical protein [Caulobacterales bacterium]
GRQRDPTAIFCPFGGLFVEMAGRAGANAAVARAGGLNRRSLIVANVRLSLAFPSMNVCAMEGDRLRLRFKSAIPHRE